MSGLVPGGPGVRPENGIYQFLTDSGASEEMAVDGSVTPVEFCYDAPAGKRAFIHRIMFVVLDLGTAVAGISEFGKIAGGLTNGCAVHTDTGAGTGVVLDFDSDNIKINGQWHFLAGGTDTSYDAVGAGSQIVGVTVRWTLSRGLGRPLELTAGERFVTTINDDLTPLVSFKALAQGYLEDL